MKRTLSVILMSAIISTTVISTPMSLVADKSTTEKEDKIKSPFEEGKTLGEKMGKDEGEIKGKKDAIDKNEYDWIKRYSIPTSPFGPGKGSRYLDGFREGHKEAFEIGYSAGYLEVITDGYDPGIITNKAKETGVKDAESDFYRGLSINPDRNMLSDREIVRKFNLGAEHDKYIEVFIVLYKTEYAKEYKNKYRTLRIEDTNDKFDEGIIKTKAIETGVKDAESDFYKNLSLDSNRNMLSDQEIITKFKLNSESAEYKEMFIILYKNEYAEAYKNKYRELRIEDTDEDYDEGIIKNKAKEDGVRDAISDFKKNLPIDSNRNLLSDQQIIKKFNISSESETYIEGFLVLYKKEYVKEYTNKYRDLRLEDEEEEEDTTEDFDEGIIRNKAKETAEKDAISDFKKNLPIDSNRNMLSGQEIIQKFKLSSETSEYREMFIKVYQEEYAKVYTDKYRDLRLEDNTEDFDEGIIRNAAKLIGEEDAELDFYKNLDIDINRNMLSDQQIIQRFNIGSESAGYKEMFIIVYKEEYVKSYTDKYRELRMEDMVEEYDQGVIRDRAKEMAEKDAKSDYRKKLPIDSNRNMLSDQDIIKKFNIGSDTVGYQQMFVILYKKEYAKEYTKIYRELRMEDMKDIIDEFDQGIISDMAETMGEQDAIADFYQNLPINSDRNMLSDQEIVKKFNIGSDTEEYQEVFVSLYKKEYTTKYNEKYRELRKDNFDIDALQGYEDGVKIGEKMGEYSGKIDFVTPNAPNNWETSFRRFEAQKRVSDRYFLDREVEQYKKSFVIGFREAYRLAYNEAYRGLNVDISENNINYVKVAGKAEELAFKPSDGVGNLGGTLKIDNATFYQETHLGISMDRDSFNHNNLKYKPVNHVYNVAVDNRGQAIRLEKPMTLNLEYYGNERAGIYQFINGKWEYMSTKVSNGSLEAKIPAGMFKGGKYAMFIDEDYKPIKDIRRHWATDELYTFLRRDYIKGDKHTNYYPNAPMFRGEFLDVLGKAMGWDYDNMYDDTSRFKDKGDFWGYKNAINYAANMGYVSGGTDGKFKPYDNITYNQVEWILKKVLYDNDFKWDRYEEQIRHDKFTNTESVKGKNRPIKRGEVIYMLNKIQQHNLI